MRGFRVLAIALSIPLTHIAIFSTSPPHPPPDPKVKFFDVTHIQHIPHFWTPYLQYTYSDSPQHRQFSPHTHFQYPLTYTPTNTITLIKKIVQKFFDSFLMRSGRKAQDTQISSIFSDSATPKIPFSHHFCPHPRHP